jgi:hypothetical protein
MTVGELIAILRERPESAPVYLWDGDCAAFTKVDSVSLPAASNGSKNSALPKGGVVIWGE